MFRRIALRLIAMWLRASWRQTRVDLLLDASLIRNLLVAC
jgi:hypothetical protein